MSRAVTMSALLAWIILQVPVVLCTTACQTSAKSLLGFAGHACHDADSRAHLRKCGTTATAGVQDRHASHEHAPASRHGGSHVVLLVQSAPCGAPVTLPALHQACAGFGWADVLADLPGSPPSGREAVEDESPPRASDPVSDSIRVQV